MSGLAPALTFRLFASLPAGVSTQAGIPIAFASAAATHIVQAAHPFLPIAIGIKACQRVPLPKLVK